MKPRRTRFAGAVSLDVVQTLLPDGRIELRVVQLPFLRAAARTRPTAAKYLAQHVSAWVDRTLQAAVPGRAVAEPSA